MAARETILRYPPSQVLINTIENLMNDGVSKPTLANVAKAVAAERPDFALDLFVAAPDRDQVLVDDGGGIDFDKFEEGFVYSTRTTFHYKRLLIHVGILTEEKAHDTKSDLDPTEDIRALETPL